MQGARIPTDPVDYWSTRSVDRRVEWRLCDRPQDPRQRFPPVTRLPKVTGDVGQEEADRSRIALDVFAVLSVHPRPGVRLIEPVRVDTLRRILVHDDEVLGNHLKIEVPHQSNQQVDVLAGQHRLVEEPALREDEGPERDAAVRAPRGIVGQAVAPRGVARGESRVPDAPPGDLEVESVDIRHRRLPGACPAESDARIRIGQGRSCPLQEGRMVFVVAVQQRDQFAAGGGNAGISGRGRTAVPGQREHADSRIAEATDDVAGVVGAAVIDDEDLEVVERLSAHAVDCATDQIRAVEGGNDDRKQRRAPAPRIFARRFRAHRRLVPLVCAGGSAPSSFATVGTTSNDDRRPRSPGSSPGAAR